MMKRVKCKTKSGNFKKVKVRIIKAPIVDTIELRNFILQRARAIVL